MLLLKTLFALYGGEYDVLEDMDHYSIIDICLFKAIDSRGFPLTA